MKAEELIDLQERFILTNKLIDFSRYKNYNLWWFVDFDFFVLLDLYVKKRKVDQRTSKFITKIPPLLFLFFDLWYDLILYLVLIIVKQMESPTFSDKEKKILIFSSDRYWNRILINKEWKKSDIFFDTITNQLPRYEKLTTSLIDSDPLVGVLTFIDRTKHSTISYLPVNCEWSFKAWKEQLGGYLYFRKRYAELKLTNTFEKDLNSDEISTEMKFYFLYLYPRYIKYIRIIGDYLKKYCPDIILLENEMGRKQKALLVISHLYEIPSIAFQHGVIPPHHRGYIFHNSRLTADIRKDSEGCPIPTLTALYGNYHKNLLTVRSNYPEKSVVVMGQPRYDKIFSLKNSNESEELKKIIFGNDRHKKILLWIAGFNAMTSELNLFYTRQIFDAIREVKIHLIIKPHPLDDMGEIESILHNFKGFSDHFSLYTKDFDTLSLINISDIVLMRYSTSIAAEECRLIFGIYASGIMHN